MNNKDFYLDLLNNSYKFYKEYEGYADNGFDVEKFSFLGNRVFGFVTYDSEMYDFLGRKAMEFIKVIQRRENFEYIKDFQNYQWYLMMCNSSFFEGRLAWGTSIRGAWWDYEQLPIETCYLDLSFKDSPDFKPENGEWCHFVEALIEFSEILNIKLECDSEEEEDDKNYVVKPEDVEPIIKITNKDTLARIKELAERINDRYKNK